MSLLRIHASARAAVTRSYVPTLLGASARRMVSGGVGTGAPSPSPQGPPRAAKTNSVTTNELRFFNSVMQDGERIPMYRVIDGNGRVVDGAKMPEINEEFARKLYEYMMLLPTVDNILYNVQRQGKISFYMTSHGEEATIIGSAAALLPDDEVLGQYREMGVLLWRGFGVHNIMNQCFGNKDDSSTKGRQMPMHFASPTYHFHPISSPLATQIPQAAGVGFALKRDPARRGKNCATVYFGEGAASEGDFHAGMLLASTIPSPTLFIARNNGFAISTPAEEQYGTADGIAARGPGYGVDTIRVDGNDVLAVFAATREARRRCVEQGRGVLLEAMTYRVGHHSTSDDSFAYRARTEVEARKRADNPIARFRTFLETQGWWNEQEEEALKARLKDDVLKTFREAEKKSCGPLSDMFEDVWGGEMPWNLKEQREELGRLIGKYGNDWEPWKREMAKFDGAGQELRKKE